MNQKVDLTKTLLAQAGLEQEFTTYLNLWWKDPRVKEVGGLQLTNEGYIALIDADLKCYPVQFEDEFVPTSQLIIWMDRFIDCPYFITKKGIFVFSERMAIQLVLFSGNLEKFARAKAKKLQN